MEIETIDNLDEAKILGYFETVQGNFLLKLALLGTVLKQIRGISRLDATKIDLGVLMTLRQKYPGETIFFKALVRGNEELIVNLREEIATSLHIQSWIIFEQILKHLGCPNYAHASQEHTVSYARSIFGFSSREKKNLDFFYYLRNAILHYNGAYYAAKTIRHRYGNRDFDSYGNEGKKMVVDFDLVWSISKDLERYAGQAGSKHQHHKKGRTTLSN